MTTDALRQALEANDKKRAALDSKIESLRADLRELNATHKDLANQLQTQEEIDDAQARLDAAKARAADQSAE